MSGESDMGMMQAPQDPGELTRFIATRYHVSQCTQLTEFEAEVRANA